MSFLLAALFSTALASDLGARDLDGRPVRLDGARAVVSWSMGCAACVDELVARSRAGEAVVAVNVDTASARSQLRPFLVSRGLPADLVVVADPTGELAGRLAGRDGQGIVERREREGGRERVAGR